MSIDTLADPTADAVLVPEPLPETEQPATSTTPAVAEPRLPDVTAEFAQLLAFEGVVKDYVKRRREYLTARMLDLYRAAGAKTFEGKAPDGSTLVQFTLKENQATDGQFVVSDTAQLLDWVLDNFPTEVETKPQVREAFKAVLLDRLAYEDGEVIDTGTGLPVAGVKYVAPQPAAEPTSFGTHWKSGGKQAAVSAVRDRLVGDVLPLEAGDS